MQDATKEWRGGWICLCQSRKVEFVCVVSSPPGVVLDEHHSLCEQAIQCHMNSKCCVQLFGFTSLLSPIVCGFSLA